MTNRYELSEEAYEAAFAAFQEAVSRAPGQTAFANICRCSQGNISQLISKRSLLPERMVLRAEAATGVPRQHLRPDIYPLATTPASSSAEADVLENDAPLVICDRRAEMKTGERA